MEDNEIISKLYDEAAHNTPDIYDKILNAAKAQGLINSSGSGSASVEVKKTTNSYGAPRSVAKVAVASASKKVTVTIIASIASIFVAVAIVLTGIFAGWFGGNSGGDSGLGDGGKGSEISTPGGDGTGGGSGGTGTGTVTSGELKYVLSDDGAYYECAGFKDEPFANVVIASEYKGLPVKGVAEKAFYCGWLSECTGICKTLTSVTIPDSVTEIGEYAFYDCKALKSVTLPDGITEIAPKIFYGCNSLESITIPEGVTTIGEKAFIYCYGLESVSLPDSLTLIESRAFYNCSGLVNITLPDGLTTIEEYAFTNCWAIKSLNIPKNLTSIGKHALTELHSLENLTVDSGNSVYFSKNNCIFEKASSNILIIGCNGSVIPDDGSVTAIGERAFDGSYIESLYISASVQTIGARAFIACTKLKSVNIPEGITHIDEETFHMCGALTEIEIPSSVKVIGKGAFSSCYLKEITIPSTVTEIGEEAFEGCEHLTEVIIPDTVTKIGKKAFAGGWFTKATIYASSISDGVFEECYSFTDVFNNIFGEYTLREITVIGTEQELLNVLFWKFAWTQNESEAEMMYEDYITVHCSDGNDFYLELPVIMVEY